VVLISGVVGSGAYAAFLLIVRQAGSSDRPPAGLGSRAREPLAQSA
jgi:hypothetical protein